LNISKENLQFLPGPLSHSVTVVNTFNDDEPVVPILDAAKQLPDISFYILGDTALANKSLFRMAPPNVVFTGYLLGDEYWKRLNSSSAVMVLTTQPYSLLAGAQEGMALGKPLILSNQPALVDYFSKGVVFIEHNPESIIAGVKRAIDQALLLGQDITALEKEKRDYWETGMRRLSDLVEVTLDKSLAGEDR
jgi:glycosyltransferase involved in cell wall biosynthesis